MTNELVVNEMSQKVAATELCRLFHQIVYRVLFDALMMFELKGEELTAVMRDEIFIRYLENDEYTGLIPLELRQEAIEVIQENKKKEERIT